MYIIYVNHDSCQQINLSIKRQRLLNQRNIIGPLDCLCQSFVIGQNNYFSVWFYCIQLKTAVVCLGVLRIFPS